VLFLILFILGDVSDTRNQIVDVVKNAAKIATLAAHDAITTEEKVFDIAQRTAVYEVGEVPLPD
jgi:hypothetical protein